MMQTVLMKVHLQCVLISFDKYPKSLRVKCIRIHTDRNYIRLLSEENFIMAGDQHVGFKVQLVVEFHILSVCLGHSQIQNCQNI